MDMPLNSLMDLAVKATERGRAVLFKNKGNSQRVCVEDGHDIKLSGDKISEEAIIELLQAATDFPIISEEAGTIQGNTENGMYWIVDPIDGSLNFARNIPMACVSISLWKDGEPILGVINDFNRNEVFSGIVGKGAWLNQKPIQVSRIHEVSKAILGTGFPSKTDFSNQALLGFVGQIQAFKKIRLIGSAALSTAYVAAGRFDAYWEKGIMLWDVAAGIAVTCAAGGWYECLDAGAPYKKNVFVSNAALKEEIRHIRLS